MKLFGEERLVRRVKVLRASIKPITQIQKYPHITEPYARILKIFVTTVDLSINILIVFWNMSHTKTIKICNIII